MSRNFKDNNKTYWSCNSHKTQLKDICRISIQESKITDTITITLKKYADIILEKLSLADEIFKSEKMKNRLYQIDREICNLANQSTVIADKLLSLYEDYKNNVVNKHDYDCIRKDYTDKHTEIEKSLETLTENRNVLSDKNRFSKKLNKIISTTFNKTNNEYIYSLVKEIRIFSVDLIEIDFMFQDSFKELADFVNEWEDLV
jgi:septal ring factor EnvC (AmiA/AmiB activator)